MDTSPHTGRSLLIARPKSGCSRGFTLVEITLAIGIVAFGFVAILGLLPTGMSLFRRAMDCSIGAQIAQRVINDAQQTDFSVLIDGGSAEIFTKTVRYFNDQGRELSGPEGAVYHVNTRVLIATGLPVTGSTIINPDLATVTIQVANNPGNQELAMVPQTFLWSGAFASNPSAAGVVPMVAYSAQISRNK
jgi:uncharacterized protein (TIGR02598 family)